MVEDVFWLDDFQKACVSCAGDREAGVELSLPTVVTKTAVFQLPSLETSTALKLDPYIPCMSNGDFPHPSPLSLLKEISLDYPSALHRTFVARTMSAPSRASSPDDSFVVESS